MKRQNVMAVAWSTDGDKVDMAVVSRVNSEGKIIIRALAQLVAEEIREICHGDDSREIECSAILMAELAEIQARRIAGKKEPAAGTSSGGGPREGDKYAAIGKLFDAIAGKKRSDG